MTTTRLQIEGMTCGHCAHSVQEALLSVKGVKKAVVNLGQKSAEVESEGELDVSSALQAVAAEGYQARLTPTP